MDKLVILLSRKNKYTYVAESQKQFAEQKKADIKSYAVCEFIRVEFQSGPTELCWKEKRAVVVLGTEQLCSATSEQRGQVGGGQEGHSWGGRNVLCPSRGLDFVGALLKPFDKIY